MKKKYRALKKTEIAIDVVKFAAYIKPPVKPYFVIHSDNPNWPTNGLEPLTLPDGVIILVLPKGDKIEDYDLDEALG